jgi:DNA polymerase V
MNPSPYSNDAESLSEHTGFPNPATDSNIISLDLSTLLIKHPASTFLMRVGDDIVVVDKALEPKPLDVVVWWDEEEYALSRFRKLPPDVQPWGVVTSHIRRYRI